MKVDSFRVLRVLGFGFALGLLLLLLWGGPWVVFGPAYALGGQEYAIGLHVGLAVGFLVFSQRRAQCFLEGVPAGIVALVLAGAGFTIPAMVERFVTSSSFLLVSGSSAFAVALGLSILISCSLYRLAAQATPARRVEFLVSAAIAFAIYAIVTGVVASPAVFGMVCLAALVLATVFSGLAHPPKTQRDPSEEERASDGGGSENETWSADLKAGRMLELVSCVFLLEAECVMVSQMGQVVQNYQIAMALVTALMVAVLWFGRRMSPSVSDSYLVLFPVVATMLLAFPFIGPRLQALVIFADNVIMQGVLVFVMVDPLGSTEESNPIRSFTITMALLATFHVSSVVGLLAGQMMQAIIYDPLSWRFLLSIAGVYLFSALAFFLMWRRMKAGSSLVRSGERSPDADEPSGDSGHVSDGGAVQMRDTIAVQCEKAAADYNLSEREREVLELLMRGRDVPAIARIASISQNTVRYHMKNLYLAFDVHNKQDLIDIVEGSSTLR